jgi:hydroxymethyl cephem carbamoyltransferase
VTLIVAMKPGHDGTITAIEDGRLLFSLEAEKDSFARYSVLGPDVILELAARLGGLPDVVAVGGWHSKLEGRREAFKVRGIFGAGYFGEHALTSRESRFFGKRVRYLSSSHERSHILGAIGLAPRGEHPLQAVLVWEGITGAFYLVDGSHQVVRTIPVLDQPGGRFAALFAISDPSFPATGGFVRLGDAGKLMALAAFAGPGQAGEHATAVVDRLMAAPTVFPVPKWEFADSPLYDCGVESELCKSAAALLTERIFRAYAQVAVREIPAAIPLRISGGCGLNCDWNRQWRELRHFSEVFVPPCPNDSGSAIGTAIDAAVAITGDPYIDWSVYSGLEFVTDSAPDPARWDRAPLRNGDLAARLRQGAVVAWVQGRWEIGPRALGNRSLLAEPFHASTRDRLNEIKQRECYRPIAPVARAEDLAAVFEDDFEDPYMLYFRRVRDSTLRAVTHVDGSARAQTVSRESNGPLHDLLTAFAGVAGVGVLCNTSLNFNGHGFINRMSHLTEYCEARGITDMVVGDTWYRRIER